MEIFFLIIATVLIIFGIVLTMIATWIYLKEKKMSELREECYRCLNNKKCISAADYGSIYCKVYRKFEMPTNVTPKQYEEWKAKANKYDSLVEVIRNRIKSVDECYEKMLTDIGGIKIINVSGLSRKEKEKVINKRNCLIVQKETFKEVLELLDIEK